MENNSQIQGSEHLYFLVSVSFATSIETDHCLKFFCLFIVGYYIEFCFSFIKICLNSNSDSNTSFFFFFAGVKCILIFFSSRFAWVLLFVHDYDI